jgi:NAD(P)-dependent dehydrogenase (short-subunit alcohol dehydrogenase family)
MSFDELASPVPRRALVTGGAGGIGRAVVEKLLAADCRVVVIDRSPTPFEHRNLLSITADITDAAQVDRSFSQVNERFGRLDVLVSNAGVGIHERLDEGDPDKWRRVVETNLIGAMRVVRAFVPLLDSPNPTPEPGSEQERRPKDVVVISSVADRKPYAYGAAYCASKAGLSAMAEALRLELMPEIRVACMRPGMVQTSFFDNSIAGSSPGPEDAGYTALPPEQVAEAVWFILDRPRGVAVNELTIRPSDQPF